MARREPIPAFPSITEQMTYRLQIPSVEQVLSDTRVGNGFHRWPTCTGVKLSYVEVPADVLRPVLEMADDPSDYNWDDKVSFSDGNWCVDGKPVCDIYGFAPTAEVKA